MEDVAFGLLKLFRLGGESRFYWDLVLYDLYNTNVIGQKVF